MPHPVVEARAYFRATGTTCGEYFVPMQQSATNHATYWAILPAPASARSVAFRIVTDPGTAAETRSGEVAVGNEVCDGQLSPEEQYVAQNTELGLTSSAQNDMPGGFRCDGIIAVITTSFDLKPSNCQDRANNAGRKVRAAAEVGAGVISAIVISNARKDRVSPSGP